MWSFPDLDSSVPICPFLSIGTFPLCCSGISPIPPFPLSRPIKSTCKRYSKMVRNTIRAFPEKIGNPPVFETPPVYILLLGGRFGYFFLFFSDPGQEGKGESGATGREGGRFSIENPRRRGVCQEGVGGGEGAGRQASLMHKEKMLHAGPKFYKSYELLQLASQQVRYHRICKRSPGEEPKGKG